MQVRIMQKWNNTSKVQAHLLYDKFLAYLVNQCQNLTKHRSKPHAILSQLSVLKRFYRLRNKSKKENLIPWIERLLKTPVPDHRNIAYGEFMHLILLMSNISPLKKHLIL